MRRPFWNGNTHYHPLVISALPPGIERVLDVGCGDGILTGELFDAGIPHVVAIDRDQAVLQRAQERHRHRKIEWRHADINDASLQPESFDAVVSVATLHHLDAAVALQRFAQLVRPGGVVVVVGLAAADGGIIRSKPSPRSRAGCLASFTAIGNTRRQCCGPRR